MFSLCGYVLLDYYCNFTGILSVNSSELVQRVAINEIGESVMAFNFNYKDTGLFGIYAVAKVSEILGNGMLWSSKINILL